MPKIVSPIVKTVKMNQFRSSGDGGQRGDHYGYADRNRFESRGYGESWNRHPGNYHGSGRQYDNERYGRSFSGSRYDRPRSPTSRYYNSGSFRDGYDHHNQYRNPSEHRFGRERFGGSLERMDQSRRQQYSSGSRRFGMGSYDDDRYGKRDRYDRSIERFPSGAYGDYQRGKSYSQRGNFFDNPSRDVMAHRSGREFGDQQSSRNRSGYGYPSQRHGYDSGRSGFSRPPNYGEGRGIRGGRFDSPMPDNYRFEHSRRPGFDGSDRRNMPFDRFHRNPSGRVRFSNDHESGAHVRPRFNSGERHHREHIGQFRGTFPVPHGNFGRPRPGDDGFAFRDMRYQTEEKSNINRRFEPFMSRRTPQMPHPQETVRNFEMQGGSQFQGGKVSGYQYGNDRMPAPIPAFSEPRSHYPSMKALTYEDESPRGGHQCREMAVRAAYDLMKRRYYERSTDPSQNPTWLQRGAGADSQNLSAVSPDVLRVESVDFKPVDNSKEHRTFEYELVQDQEQPTPIFRRGQTFTLTMNFCDREFDSSQDNIYLNFYFGPNPSVPKRTRVVLPIIQDREFEKVPHQWDARIQSKSEDSITIEVHVPATSPVGMWRCIVETSTHDNSSNRLQWRCPEDIYIIFNPFVRDDVVYMENDAQRYEYVVNDCGKVYTGGFRNVRGRPWIYGQFDDCVLPAAVVLLEMSGLPHAERGNPVKVAKALSSMIKASNPREHMYAFCNNSGVGLIEAKFEDDYRGGNSPHLWTGSVQIIEEFLRAGATPVKYAQCWVMSALMATLCRTLGLPARPVTAFVSALNTQDSMTVDRYVDRFGDVIERGPSHDQPDSIWAFHTWCDVWMARPDQPQGYSGWQATDPCRSFWNFKDWHSSGCGPCPIEALRRGDVGQREDVNAFYASLNSYVRYFYEDEESGWGYSPFRQFRYPVSRYILTKSVGRFDEEGDNDFDDLTNVYRDNERSDFEKFETFNSCRGIAKDTPPFEYQAAAYNWGPFNPNETDQRNYDVSFELDAPQRVMVGQVLTIPVVISNNADEPRNIQTNICTRSSYYTGVGGPYLKRCTSQLVMAPNQQETITLSLDPCDYEDKLVDMAFIKITVTSFVKETGQSFIDEFDFRFTKPCLKVDVPELRIGTKSEANFSFSNPLDIPLTDCFLTMEISGCVRPRTVRIDRDVRPGETFSYSQSFVPRASGERRVVVCFASRQLQDVVGQRSVVVQG